MDKTNRVVTYDKRQHFFLKVDPSNQAHHGTIGDRGAIKVGAIALGLKGDTVTITGSAASPDDVVKAGVDYDPNGSLSIAYARLRSAGNQKTRQLNVKVADIGKLTFKTLVTTLNLVHNQFISDHNGVTWSKIVLDEKRYDEILQNAVRWLTSPVPVVNDQLLADLITQRDEIELKIKDRKLELKRAKKVGQTKV